MEALSLCDDGVQSIKYAQIGYRWHCEEYYYINEYHPSTVDIMIDIRTQPTLRYCCVE